MTNQNYIALQVNLLLLITAIVLVGCSQTAEDGLPVKETTAENIISPTTEPIGAGGAQFGETAKWPDYIPPDIPALAGEIETVMVGGSHIRLFYKNVPQNQVLDYLDLLEGMGFALEYRVYVQEGFPDNSEEKIARGEFDAVDITKGEYHMTITYGADPTYDIYLSGFEEEAIAATTLQWPAELPKSVPPPPNCVLQTINPSNNETYYITCRKEGENAEEAYIQLLLASGFEEKNGTTYQDQVFEITVFENDEAIVIPDIGFSPTFFSIQVIRKVELEPLQWPVELAGLVPQPAQCEINSILPTSPSSYLISCSAADDHVLPDYLSLLAGSGFEETTKMVGQDNVILSVSVEKEGAKVQLMNSGMDSSILIDVYVVQP
jgi:hypothetical protein